MPNLAISGLTSSAANLTLTDLVPVVQTAGVGPVKMTGAQVAAGLLGSTVLTGSSVSTSQPLLDLTQTWNGVGVVFRGLALNVTDTNSALLSGLIDLRINNSTWFRVGKSTAAGWAALWCGPGLTPSSANYTLLSNGSTLYVNAPVAGNSVAIGVNNLTYLSVSSTSANLSSGVSLALNSDVILARDSAAVARLENCLLLKGIAFASLPASPVAGTLAKVTDSTVTTGQIAGGGANTVIAYYKSTATAGWYVLAAL